MWSVSGADADGWGMAVAKLNRPVFYDDSGVRAVAVQWTGRATCLLGVLVCLAVAATLGTHVSLPGLDRLHPLGSLVQRPDASRSVARRDAIEPLPIQIVNGNVRPAGTERTAVVTQQPIPPARTATEPAVERSAATRTGSSNARAVGSTPPNTGSQTGPRPEAASRGRDGITAPPGLGGGARAGGEKATRSKALETSGKSSTRSASRASAAKSKPDPQARTGPAKGAGTVKAPKQKASRADARP